MSDQESQIDLASAEGVQSFPVAEPGTDTPDNFDLDAQFRELDHLHGHELAGELARHVQKMNAVEYSVEVGPYTVKVVRNAQPQG